MNTVTLESPKTPLHWAQLYKLYLNAFPRSERKPFSIITRQYRKGIFDVWCVRQKGQFAGLAITVKSGQLVLLDYLAIKKDCRNQGIGTAVLSLLQQKYAGKDLFLEIESVYEDAPDLALRQRRKQFYLRCGMTPMGVMICLFGVNMELLGFDCKISFDRYYQFYMDNVGSWAAGHVTSLPHPENITNA